MQKNINGILMRTVVVLLVLVCLSTAMVTGRYARYYSISSATDSARVAKFEVTVSTQNIQSVPVLIQPGETVNRYINVENKSEVAVALGIQVKERYGNLPLKLKYSEAVPLAPGESKDVPLEIMWEKSINDSQYIGRVDLLEISLRVEQID